MAEQQVTAPDQHKPSNRKWARIYGVLAIIALLAMLRPTNNHTGWIEDVWLIGIAAPAGPAALPPPRPPGPGGAGGTAPLSVGFTRPVDVTADAGSPAPPPAPRPRLFRSSRPAPDRTVEGRARPAAAAAPVPPTP